MSSATAIDLANKLDGLDNVILCALDEMGFIDFEIDSEGSQVVDASGWHPIDGKQLNHYGTAWTDGTYLMFVGYSVKRSEQFLYYMGAEREAEIDLKLGEVIVYSEINPDRLERWAND